MRIAVAAALCLVACGDNLPRPPDPTCDSWQQWGRSSAHTGESCSTGQPLQRILAQVTIDPLEPKEVAGSGDLLVHYQVPLLAGDRVYMMRKAGTYTPCVPVMFPEIPCAQPGDLGRFNSQIWGEVGYAWQDGALVPHWTFDSDWKPPPLNETIFQPVLVDDKIEIPGAQGAIWELDAASGQLIRHITPLGDDPDTYIVGALAADWGSVYYNAIHVDHDDPYGMPQQAWLVAIRRDGSTAIADYTSLVHGAPGANDSCYTEFDGTKVTGPLPPPPNADGTPVLPQQAACGAQVPGFNASPAFAFNSRIYIVSHAQNNYAYSYISAIEPGDLSPDWSTSLRDRLHDGCGVNIPYAADAPTATFFKCRDGAPRGVDPFTGMAPAAMVEDSSSSSPVALPHGGVIYGSYSFYNHERGHLVKLDDDGHFVGSYDFGWDLTPAVLEDGDRDEILLKDNHYAEWMQTPGPYYLTRLDSELDPMWQFQNTEMNTCVRNPDGTLSCSEDHPQGFEWCVNAPAIDREGTIYANSEDGHLYAITASGELRDRIFLDEALGSSYTPLSIDHAGRIFALNAGTMFVIGAN
jgi:outer membrane protein assembly factor BamB